MALAEHIAQSLNLPNMVVHAYLDDLSDANLMVRPVPGANHIAWQLGHLISSEHQLIELACPGKMPPLPEGFKERHDKATAGSDNPEDFLTKAEYFRLMDEQRAGTLALLAGMSDEQLAQPSPMPRFAATVGGLFSGQGSHWMMHAGQWVIVRRTLGLPAKF